MSTAPTVELVRKYYAADEVNFTPGERSFVAWASVEVVDHEGDVVVASGVDYKSVYMKNPVVMAVHDYGKWPLGQCEWMKVKTSPQWSGLYAKCVIDDTPDTEIVWKKIQARTVRGISIGFRPPDDLKRGEWGPPTADELKRNPHWAGAKRVIRRCLMIEQSVCPIGMNPGALIEAVSKGMNKPRFTEPPAVPYELARRKKGDRHGWVVRNRETGRVYSNEPLSHDDALAQLRAIEIHTHGKSLVPDKEPKGRDLIGIHKAPFNEFEDDMEPWEDGDEVGTEGDAEAEVEGRKAAPDAEAKAHAEPDAEPDGDDDDADDAPGPIRQGHFVRVTKGPHKGVVGKVKSVHRAGLIPDVDDDVPVSKADPGLKVNVYKAMGDGHRESTHHVGCKMAHAERIEDLKPPKRAAKAVAEALPPLMGKTDAEVKAEQLNRFRTELPEAFRRQQERLLGAV